MFAYGQLSDLKDGSLVTPIKKENGKIKCIDSNGNEILLSFEDFDFDKNVADRIVIEAEVEDESVIDSPTENEEPDFYWEESRDKLIFIERVQI